MNVSGGEPREVQDNVWEEPTTTVTVDDDGVSITGATVYVYQEIKMLLMGHI